MTDQTQTTTEPVAWRVRPKGALGDAMGVQIVTNPYVAKDYAEQPAFEVQPLYTTPQPLAIGLSNRLLFALYETHTMRTKPSEALMAEIDAHFNSLALAAPADGYVLVPVDVLAEALFTADRLRKNVTPDWIGLPREYKDEWRRKAACLPAAPTGASKS